MRIQNILNLVEEVSENQTKAAKAKHTAKIDHAKECIAELQQQLKDARKQGRDQEELDDIEDEIAEHKKCIADCTAELKKLG